MNYTKLYNPNKTPQTEAIHGKNQVQNNAGGYTFALDKWARLERFLILGSDSATYYQSAENLTKQNAQIVVDCWSEDPARTARMIVDISREGRAAKQDPAIYALALGVNHLDIGARQAAFAAVGPVCRTASHLFQWMNYSRSLGKGWGRGMKRTVANWYGSCSNNKLAYQMIKYRQRSGYTHKRAIELAHKGAGNDSARKALYRWVRGKGVAVDELPELVQAHLKAMIAPDRDSLIDLVANHRLPWEAIPTSALNDPGVWKAMLPNMPMTALIRNLGNMTSCEAIEPMDCGDVVARLQDDEAIRKSRLHPFTVLQALAVYKAGHGVRGSKSWTPVTQVVDALDGAFYKAFKNVPTTGKNIMIALDVSGSMDWDHIQGSLLTAREAAAAMSLVTLAAEPNTHVVGFCSGLRPLQISARQRLDDVISYTKRLSFGGTDCAKPMLYAERKKIPVDAFVIYTDNETWAGGVHPVQALDSYRKTMSRDAKCIVVGMTSTGFSIADPDDGGMLDLVGFDSAAPSLISDFIRH